ncbi:DUF4232 domain-containing protein [Umezawaea sp. Da 62-37]|uniref:DUF4232 domain-containing protein n=1 Tax=Umezawaea sp. Da 62-37 TaxID=3075927 RepID=UPI0028F6E315|nr:DUF4232 domain-containing protein [Umezawaea sp. Da 62-37]WNV90971.1 DUF4232 domain-containing protein [Umezawaea sp. Da 62-37]
MRKNNSRVIRGAATIAVLAAFGTLSACSVSHTGTPAVGGEVTPSSSAAKQAETTGGGTRVTGGADALRANGSKPSGEQFCATALVELGADFPVEGANDQFNVPIMLTNDSTVRCTIQGFPGVQFQKDNGESWDLVRGDDPIKPVSLAPGQATGATLVFLSSKVQEGTSHWTPDSILITPPNTSDTQRLTWDFGTIVRQDAATHPGTYVRAVDAVDYSDK